MEEDIVLLVDHSLVAKIGGNGTGKCRYYFIGWWNSASSSSSSLEKHGDDFDYICHMTGQERDKGWSGLDWEGVHAGRVPIWDE